MALIHNAPRAATVITKTDVVVLELEKVVSTRPEKKPKCDTRHGARDQRPPASERPNGS